MKTFLKITGIFFIWRVLLFLIGAIADRFLVYAPSFPYADALLVVTNLPRWLYSWGNFDGVHYLTIITRGYHGADLIQAFFPLYPFLSKLFGTSLFTGLLTALLVSNVSFILLLFIWYKFIAKNYSSQIAVCSTASILLFPTSFFFTAVYTESLFLLFVIGAFWSAQEKKYWLTAFCIALASATRITGVLLLPAIIFEIFFAKLQWGVSVTKVKAVLADQLRKWQKFMLPSVIVSFGLLGLLSYMYYLHKEFGDFLYFFHVQSEFGGGVRQETIVSYPQVVWRYIKILLTSRPIDWKYFSYVQDFIASTLGLLGIVYATTKVKISYVIFAVLAFFLPTLTGTFSSMPRYILVCFPLFILLGIFTEKSKVFRSIWFTLSGFLLVLNTVLFIQGYWVA